MREVYLFVVVVAQNICVSTHILHMRNLIIMKSCKVAEFEQKIKQ